MKKDTTPHAGPQGTARRGDEPANRKGGKPALPDVAIEKRRQEFTPIARTTHTESQHGQRNPRGAKKK